MPFLRDVLPRRATPIGGRVTIVTLNWSRRFTCGGCGAKSRRATVAGAFLATPKGWRCPKCWQTANHGEAHSAEIEQAPRGEGITEGAAPLPLAGLDAA